MNAVNITSLKVRMLNAQGSEPRDRLGSARPNLSLTVSQDRRAVFSIQAAGAWGKLLLSAVKVALVPYVNEVQA